MSGPRKKTNSKLSLPTIKKLFDRFYGIWGSDWQWRIESNPKLAAKEWAEALGEFDIAQIAHAVSVARVKHVKPPSIADFKLLCASAKKGHLLSMSDAAEVSEHRLRKKFKPSCPSDLYLERDLLLILQTKIYTTQNALADIVFCDIDACRHYLIVDCNDDTKWLCREHKNNEST